MADLNITPASFESGLLCIATNVHTEAELETYIDEYEKKFLLDLLGCDLYELFIADLVNGVPQTQIYLDIYNEFCIDEDACHIQKRSEGMLTMLKKFIFWEYIRDQKVKNTTSGNIVNDNEASREASFPESKLYSVYNEGIKSYCNIQWYICENSTNYPDYNGIRKQKTSWL